MKRFFLLIALLVFSVFYAGAQEIRVMGKVVSTVDDGPLDGVYIWVFKTVGAGKAEHNIALDLFNQEMEYPGPAVGRDERSMADGTYNFVAEAGGSLIFHLPPFKPVFVPIKGRNELPVVKIEATTVLDDSMVDKTSAPTLIFPLTVDIEEILADLKSAPVNAVWNRTSPPSSSILEIILFITPQSTSVPI